MTTATTRSWIEGPRWAGLEVALKKRAIELRLGIECEVHKGLLRETVFFTLRGENSAIKEFLRSADKAVTDWNSPEEATT